MRTIVHNKFFEFNFILFPIWILPVYLFFSNIIESQEYVFLVCLILIPLTGQFFHYYIDAFIWRFSDPHIREVTGKRLFS